jgi:hypothetical protein
MAEAMRCTRCTISTITVQSTASAAWARADGPLHRAAYFLRAGSG